MAEDSDKEDRTEAPSGRKLEQARQEGNVPRSRELATFAVTMAGVALLISIGAQVFAGLKQSMRYWLSFDQERLKDPMEIMVEFRQSLFDITVELAPILGGLFLVAMLTPLLIGGWNFTSKGFMPNFGKLNPLSGIKRLFSVDAATEGLKAILKSALIGGVATWVIWSERDELIGLVRMPLDAGLLKLADLMEHTFLIVVGSMLLLVVIDVPFQLWQYTRNLRMTKEEVKKEFKEQEGSPEVKGRIRQLQREAARRRMMQEVPGASVIVTNPTHYAVAIKYEDKMGAPVMVAKGTLKLAEKIIQMGEENKVTILRTPSYARALYFNMEPGDEIPANLYTATAQVLAYIHQLKHFEQHGGMAPIFPEQLEVPPELDPESKRQQHSPPKTT